MIGLLLIIANGYLLKIGILNMVCQNRLDVKTVLGYILVAKVPILRREFIGELKDTLVRNGNPLTGVNDG